MKEKDAKKIRIAIVATSTRQIGGQSIQAKRLIDAFSDDKEIELIFIPNNPETAFEKIKYLRTVFASLKFWALLFREIPKARGVQIFSSGSTGYIISTLPALFVAKIFGKKTILNYHSGELAEHIEKWKLTAKPTMKMFDEIVVPSQFLVDVFARFGLKARAIANSVETEKFKFKRRETLRPVFLSNRNFDAHYNVSCILRAFRLIQDRIPRARLIVAGYGREESDLKNLAKELKLENVEFRGKIANEKMAEIYDEADIYLNSSVVDNMPLSFIEAFSCGLPIVSTDAGGISYIVENGKTGILVEKNDCRSIAGKALWLLENNDSAQKIIENARNEVRKYAPEAVKKGWRAFYLEII
jgi:glycosyltransferase involved in cell wall biosynthesis